MYARHWKRRMLSVAVAIAMVVTCIVALDATCAYAGPISGTHRNLDRSKTSDVLIIGDSRIEMLAELNNVTTKKASYNATVTAIAPMPSMLVPITMMTSFSPSPMTDRTTNVTNSLRLLIPSLCENTKRMDAK